MIREGSKRFFASKLRKLSVRDRKFIKSIFEGKTPTQAMRDAGYSEETALAKQSEKVGKLAPTIRAVMDYAGLSDDTFMKTLKEGLEATKVISAMIVSQDVEGKKDVHSMTRDFIEVPDYLTRHKYLETAHKLRGDYPDEKVNVTHSVETHEERLRRFAAEEATRKQEQKTIEHKTESNDS